MVFRERTSVDTLVLVLMKSVSTARRSFASAAVACLLVLGAVRSGHASVLQPPPDPIRSGCALSPGPLSDTASFAEITLDQAVAMAERRFQARVVRAETQRDGERIIYVLRLLNSAGRVWTVRVDAQTGQIQ